MILTPEHSGLKRLIGFKRVTLTTHPGADADGLGSALALRAGLKQLGIATEIILPDPLYRRVAFLAEGIPIQVFGTGDSSEDWIAKSDCVVSLDTLGPGRHSPLGKWVALHGVETLAIDHHLGESESTDLLFPDVAATGEIVFGIFEAMNLEITPAVASWLYASLSSDTCSFRFVRGRAEIFDIAATLIRCGADPWAIQEGLFQSSSSDALQLFARAAARRTYLADQRVALVWFEENALSDLTLDRDDFRDMIQLLISEDTVRVAITVTSRGPSEYKLSMRGRKGVNLVPLARKFGGGGHAQACGATAFESESTILQVLNDKIDQFV